MDSAQNFHIETINEVLFLKSAYRSLSRAIFHFFCPDYKQWVIIHTSDSMMIVRQSIYILSIITREMGKLKTHSPTYCIMDNWEYMLYLTHLTKCIWQAFFKSNVFRQVCTMIIMRWCNVQINEYDLQAKMHPVIFAHQKLHNNNENKFPVFSELLMHYVTEYDVTNISGTQPWKDMTTMGKVDTFDLMMIITWAKIVISRANSWGLFHHCIKTFQNTKSYESSDNTRTCLGLQMMVVSHPFHPFVVPLKKRNLVNTEKSYWPTWLRIDINIIINPDILIVVTIK